MNFSDVGLSSESGVAVTFVNAGTISGNTSINGTAADIFLNQGSIDVGKGASFVSYGAQFTNAGTIKVTGNGGASLNLDGAWSNKGTIDIAGSGNTLSITPVAAGTDTGVIHISAGNTLAISGTTTGTLTTAELLATLGQIKHAGVTIGVNGTLDNTGATLTLGESGLVIGADGISGGTIVNSGDGLVADPAGFVYLEGVTCQGTFDLTTAGEEFYFTGGVNNTPATAAATFNVTGAGAYLILDTTETADNIIINLGSGSNEAALYGGHGSGQTLTLGSNAAVTQTGTDVSIQYGSSSGGGLINQGTITADIAGAAMILALADSNGYGELSNQGTLLATNGGTLNLVNGGKLANLPKTVLTGGTWQANAGSDILLKNNATVTTDAATIILSGAGSTIEALDTTTNTEITLDQTLNAIAATGTLELLAGRDFVHVGSITDAGLLDLGGGTVSATSLAIVAGGTLAGFGTVTAPLADGGTISATAGTLTLSGNVSGAGRLGALAGATIDLTAGGTLTEVISGAGTLELGGTTPYSLVAGSALSIATVALDTGATLSGAATLTGALVDAGTVSATGGTLILKGPVSGAGALSIAAGATLDVTDGGTFGGKVSGAGTLRLAGANAFVLQAGATLAAAALVDAGATLDLQNAGSLPANISGGGTLELGGAFTLGSAAPGIATIRIDAGASLSGAGVLSSALMDNGTFADGTGAVTLNGALTGNGTLSAGAGAVIHVSAGGHFAGAISGAGTVRIGNPFTLAAGASLSVANLIASASVTLAAGANLTNLAGDTLTLAAAAGKIVDLGGAAAVHFTNAGNLAADGNGTADLGVAFINSGNVSASSGTLAFLHAVTNSGTIDAAGGLVSFAKAPTGTGTLEIGATGTISLLAGAAATQTVDFLAPGGVLNLADPDYFKATIESFAPGNQIDLLNTSETSFTYANGILTVKDTTTTVAALHFTGTYTQADFIVGSDGHGGTSITYS
jgi:hypothetical protein